MRPSSEAYDEMDFMPTIADGERVRFEIRHVRGVRRLRFQRRLRDLIGHPVTLVVVVWIVMALMLALEVWK